MKRVSRRRFWLVSSLFCWVVFSSPAHAEGVQFSLGLGFEVASGDYGTGTSTESVYLPLTIAAYPTKRLGFSVEIPYVYQSSSAVNTTVFTGPGGQMAGVRKDAAAMTPGGNGTPGAMAAGTPGQMSTATSARATQSYGGLGDITLKGGYVLVEEADLVPRVRPYLFVKLPTADRDRALGTGEFDEGLAVEFSKFMGNWFSFAETGYTFQGNSDLIPLKNYLSYQAGTGYVFGDRFLPMLIAKGSTAPVEGASHVLELKLKLKYMATQRTGIEGFVAKGVTRSSPDYGSGVAVFYDF